MKAVLSLIALACFCLVGVAQDKSVVPGVIKTTKTPDGTVQTVTFPKSEATPAELEFLKTGPRLYTMDKALELSKETGKPVVCWMGKHLFADPKARALSAELGETTIQAAMDDDGETGKLDPKTGKRIPELRVKFSSNAYKDARETAYIPVTNFDRPGTAERILAFSRGGR